MPLSEVLTFATACSAPAASLLGSPSNPSQPLHLNSPTPPSSLPPRRSDCVNVAIVGALPQFADRLPLSLWFEDRRDEAFYSGVTLTTGQHAWLREEEQHPDNGGAEGDEGGSEGGAREGNRRGGAPLRGQQRQLGRETALLSCCT